MTHLVNPYQAGRPVADLRLLFGREGSASWLEQQLVVGQRVVLLYGPPLIGKTSLARHLPEMFTVEGLFLYLSLGDIETYTLNSVLNHTMHQLVRQLVAGGLVLPNEIDTAADTIAALGTLLSVAQKNRSAARVVLIFDDLHLLGRAGLGLLFEFLEVVSVWQAKVPSLQVVFTADARWESQLQHPLLDTAPVHYLGTLALDDALQLITRPVEGVLRFDYGVTRRIAEINSQHPYFLNLFSYTLFNRHAREGWVNLRYVDETLDYLLGLSVDAFEQLWSEANGVERAVLSAMSAKRGTHGLITRQEVVTLLAAYDREVKEDVVVQALESLAAQGVLVRMGALSYRFYVELFRYWIDRHHKPADVVRRINWTSQAPPEEPLREATPAEAQPARRRGQPIWLIGLVGLALVGALLLGGLVAARSMGWLPTPDPSDQETAATAPAGQPRSEPVSAAEATATPAPTQPPTPTPPLVVARTLPSIAFMARDVDGAWRIYVMNSDGTEVRPLSVEAVDDTSPAWSYDGQWLAFVSQRDGNREVYVMDAEGQRVRNVSQNPADDWTPAWSPDGRQLAFSSNRFGGWEIFLLDADCVTSDNPCEEGALRQLTNDGGGNISPVWSPDGQRLLFSSKRDGNWEVYSMAVDGTDVRRLTNNEESDLAPVWSPTGEMVAFESSRDGNVEVYVMTAVGGNPRNVSNMPFADDHGPTWSPDGERLLFYSNREGNWDLFLTSLDGSTLLNLTQTPDRDEQTPAWRP